MDSSSRQQPASRPVRKIPLLGRDSEKAAIADVISSVHEGLSGACVLRGEAGMGKTLLLDFAETMAGPDLVQIRVAGVDAESDLGYAALHRLLLPLLNRRVELPEGQRLALETALGLDSDRPADRFLVGLACLTLLADVASDNGLLCIVDDAQWLDKESLDVLTFVARRLTADKIGILFGIRALELPYNPFELLPTIDITGLPETEALSLLSLMVDGVVEPEVARRVLKETSGCPLAITEVGSMLTIQQLTEVGLDWEPLRIGKSLEDHYLKQVRLLPPDAQTFLLVAAAETSGDKRLVRAAAKSFDADAEAEESAVASGLLIVQSLVAFRHPLIRSAVYSGAPDEKRRAVHRALALLIDHESDPDRRAQHLALASTGPEEGLAVELERSADRAGRRGGYAARASFLVQAAHSSPAKNQKSARLLRAVSAAVDAGSPRRAETLLGQARPDLKDPMLLAEATRLEGRITQQLARPAAAPALLFAAAKSFERLDKALAKESLLEALDALLISLQFTTGTTIEEVARTALSVSSPPGDETLECCLLQGLGKLMGSNYTDAVPALRRALDLMQHSVVDGKDILHSYNLGLIIANELWDDHAYAVWAQKVERWARSSGALIALQVILVGLAKHETRTGRFDAAEAFYDQVLDVTCAIAGYVPIYELLKVDLDAWRGDDEATIRKARELIEIATAIGSGPAFGLAYGALATLALGRGQYGEALIAARTLTDTSMPDWTCQALHIAIEAGVRCGERDVAMRDFRVLRDRALETATPWALGQLARSRAMLGEADYPERDYKMAIDYLSETLILTELGQAHLIFGEWLRRESRLKEAKTELGLAFEMFDSMGAKAFAQRARLELAAAGIRAIRRSVHQTNDLTPQEAQVARLAASGETNQEIAAIMFISAATVAYHLQKVYRKLGISSRRQLKTFQGGT